MQRPLMIRIMLLLLYFKVAIEIVNVVMMLVQGTDQADSASIAPNPLSSAIQILLFIAVIGLIRRRKMMFALLASLVAFITSSSEIQMITTLALVLFFFWPTVRSYFRNQDIPAAPAGSGRAANAGGAIDFSKKTDGAADNADPANAPEAEVGAEAQPPVRSKLGREHAVEIREATAADAYTVHTLMLAAFEEYRNAIPPSSALEETEESIREALAAGREFALLLIEDDAAVATVRYNYVDDAICFFRLSVIPAKRRRGYARQLVKWIERQGITKGMNISRCRVRQSVQNNLVLYQNMGYEIVDQELIVRPAGTVKALTLEKKLGV